MSAIRECVLHNSTLFFVAFLTPKVIINSLFLFKNVSANIWARAGIPSSLLGWDKICCIWSHTKFGSIVKYSEQCLDQVFTLSNGFCLVTLPLHSRRSLKRMPKNYSGGSFKTLHGNHRLCIFQQSIHSDGPIRLTQCCNQFKSFQNKTFCSKYFHIIKINATLSCKCNTQRFLTHRDLKWAQD